MRSRTNTQRMCPMMTIMMICAWIGFDGMARAHFDEEEEHHHYDDDHHHHDELENTVLSFFLDGVSIGINTDFFGRDLGSHVGPSVGPMMELDLSMVDSLLLIPLGFKAAPFFQRLEMPLGFGFAFGRNRGRIYRGSGDYARELTADGMVLANMSLGLRYHFPVSQRVSLYPTVGWTYAAIDENHEDSRGQVEIDFVDGSGFYAGGGVRYLIGYVGASSFYLRADAICQLLDFDRANDALAGNAFVVSAAFTIKWGFYEMSARRPAAPAQAPTPSSAPAPAPSR